MFKLSLNECAFTFCFCSLFHNKSEQLLASIKTPTIHQFIRVTQSAKKEGTLIFVVFFVVASTTVSKYMDF